MINDTHQDRRRKRYERMPYRELCRRLRRVGMRMRSSTRETMGQSGREYDELRRRDDRWLDLFFVMCSAGQHRQVRSRRRRAVAV